MTNLARSTKFVIIRVNSWLTWLYLRQSASSADKGFRLSDGGYSIRQAQVQEEPGCLKGFAAIDSAFGCRGLGLMGPDKPCVAGEDKAFAGRRSHILRAKMGDVSSEDGRCFIRTWAMFAQNMGDVSSEHGRCSGRRWAMFVLKLGHLRTDNKI